MPTISRDPTEFLQRHGVESTPAAQRPRLNLDALKLFHVPLADNELDPSVMLDAAGRPLNDRGITDPWPPPQKVE